MNDTENKKTEVPVEMNALPAPSVFNRNLNEETIHTDASASTLAEFLIHQDEYVERMKERQDFAGEKEEEHKKLFDKLKTYMHDEKSLDLIEEAYELAEKAHAGQTRQTGEPAFSLRYGADKILPRFWKSVRGAQALQKRQVPC